MSDGRVSHDRVSVGRVGVSHSARPFDPARFAELASARSLRIGKLLEYASETGSTNDDALAAARAGAPSGSVYLADHQTHGRGRRGKTWSAAPSHNLLFSILMRPQGSPLVGALTLAVGLGVRQALADASGAALAVKWPNDVLAGERKLAGILCEGQFEGSTLAAVIIGIGINVHRPASLPPELESTSVCLEALSTRELASREALLIEVLAGVDAQVAACLEHGFQRMLPEFNRHDALAGQPIEVSGATPIRGIARGVNAEGHLLVESDGLIVPVHSGSVLRL